MGDETIQFATRFSTAVSLLDRLAGGGAGRELPADPAKLVRAVREALDAVEEVHRTGTDAVRDWTERSRHVLAQIEILRAALARSGVDGEVRRMARELVDLVQGS